MSARYIVSCVDSKTHRGAHLHTDAPPAMLGDLARLLSSKYTQVEIRCGNYYPDRDERGAALWMQGEWTPRGERELVNYIERK